MQVIPKAICQFIEVESSAEAHVIVVLGQILGKLESE